MVKRRGSYYRPPEPPPVLTVAVCPLCGAEMLEIFDPYGTGRIVCPTNWDHRERLLATNEKPGGVIHKNRKLPPKRPDDHSRRWAKWDRLAKRMLHVETITAPDGRTIHTATWEGL